MNELSKLNRHFLEMTMDDCLVEYTVVRFGGGGGGGGGDGGTVAGVMAGQPDNDYGLSATEISAAQDMADFAQGKSDSLGSNVGIGTEMSPAHGFAFGKSGLGWGKANTFADVYGRQSNISKGANFVGNIVSSALLNQAPNPAGLVAGLAISHADPVLGGYPSPSPEPESIERGGSPVPPGPPSFLQPKPTPTPREKEQVLTDRSQLETRPVSTEPPIPSVEPEVWNPPQWKREKMSPDEIDARNRLLRERELAARERNLEALNAMKSTPTKPTFYKTPPAAARTGAPLQKVLSLPRT